MRKTKKPLALLLAFLLAASLAGGHLVTANAEEDAYQTTGAAEVSGSEPESAAESSAGTADDAAAVEETGEQDSALSETEESSGVSEETSQGETEEASQEETEGTAASEAETAETAEAETDSQMPAQSFAETLDSGITVTVEAPDGALPDGSVLHAAWIGQSTEETDATAQVAAELDDAGVAYDGFVALDIYFTAGEDGAEVEPAQPVSVRLELPEGMLPAETDLESLSVQHLAENDQGQVEAVETVADASDAAQGTVTAETEVQAEEENTASAVTAEFQVGSFSSFVITWTGYSQSNISKELTVTLIDTEGKELDVTGLEDERTNSTITISEYAPYVQNHTYLRAVLASDAQSAVQSGATQVSQLQLHRESVGGWHGYYEYTWQYKNSGSWNNDWHDFDIEKQQIYLIYSQDTTGSAGDGGGDVDVDLPEPSISKTALRNEDGTYDLNLSVTGSVGSQSSTVNVDVLMIVDESNSMDTGDRIPYLKNAMRALVNTLEANEGVDARYSIVSFGTTGEEELEWTSISDPYWDINWTEVGRAINRINARGGNDGGTNYMAGFRTAQTLLNEANGDDRDAMTVVIFLSDGKPTYYYTSHDGDSRGGDGNEELGISSTGWLLTMEEADDFACDQFYSVGIGNAMSNYLNTNDAHGGLLDAVNARVSKYIEVQSDASDLTDQFEDIAGSMTDLFIENVTITDQLDLENVEPVLDGNGEPARLTVSVSDDQGQDVTETEVQAGQLAASYKDGVLKLDFDDSYGLKAGYTYTVTLQIQPTKAAEEAYRESGIYPDTPTGGVYTGTHTGETGFYSNTQATLTYYYTDNEEEAGEQSLEYPMPVVQVPEPATGSLTIQKEVAWDSENEEGNADSALFTFTITGPAEAADSEEGYPIAGTGQKVQFELVSQDSEHSQAVVTITGSNSLTVEDLPFGTYEVQETGAPDLGDDYYCLQVEGEGSVAIGMDHGQTLEASVTIANTYAKYRTITVVKDVSGAMGENNRDFAFTAQISGTAVDQENLRAITENAASVIGDGAFTLKDSGKVQVLKVKKDDVITIGETVVAGYVTSIQDDLEDGEAVTTKVDVSGSNATITMGGQDVTLTFTNTRAVVPPTGLEDSHTTPYGLMVALAVLSGAVFAGGMVARRRRRLE